MPGLLDPDYDLDLISTVNTDRSVNGFSILMLEQLSKLGVPEKSLTSPFNWLTLPPPLTPEEELANLYDEEDRLKQRIKNLSLRYDTVLDQIVEHEQAREPKVVCMLCKQTVRD